MLAVEGHTLLGPQPPHHVQDLQKARQAPAARNSEGIELDVAVSESHAEHQPPAADHVQGGEGLRHIHRMLQGQQHDTRSERHVPDLGRHACQDRERLHVLERRRQVVLAGADVMEPRPPRQPHHLQQLGEPLRHVVAHGMLHRQ